MSDPPKALTPAKLPWPARTIEEAMPDWGYKHPSGNEENTRDQPIKGSGTPERPTDAILREWDAGTAITAIGMAYGISNDTVRRLARKHGRQPRGSK